MLNCAGFMALMLFAAQPAAAEGVLEGVVVNATQGSTAAAGTEVVLRALVNGEFILLARTVTSAAGEFRFTGLPLDGVGPYLPGANRDEVHFPGPRVEVTADRPYARVTIPVFDALSRPNPLLIEDHEIVIQVEPGSLRVRETMVIDNPSATCFVGTPSHAGGGPVTLQLGIPADFQRITFDKEAFGRRFSLINEKLVTGIPWPPGKRELAFNYVIPQEQGQRCWRRQIDLPCSHISLKVRTDCPDQLTCSLPVRGTTQEGIVHYEFRGEVLQAGDVVQLDLDGLPVPPMVVARWTALGILLLLVIGVSIATVGRRPRTFRSNVEVTYG